MKFPAYAWLFDVDGVLTDPTKKRNTEPQILEEIIKRLTKGEPVALVTGRSNSWMIREVIKPLETKISDKKILNFFIGIGEKGTTSTTFENGNLKTVADKSFQIPKQLEQEIKELIASKFSKWMFLDPTKETMISIEMNDNLEIASFRRYQHQMDELLESMLTEHNLQKKYKIVSSQIATDIQDINVGKDYAAKKVLEWLKTKQIDPKKFVCFGDSEQDVEMAQYIFQQGLPVEFVFTGGKDLVDADDYSFPVVIIKEAYEKGTLEYLT